MRAGWALVPLILALICPAPHRAVYGRDGALGQILTDRERSYRYGRLVWNDLVEVNHAEILVMRGSHIEYVIDNKADSQWQQLIIHHEILKSHYISEIRSILSYIISIELRNRIIWLRLPGEKWSAKYWRYSPQAFGYSCDLRECLFFWVTGKIGDHPILEIDMHSRATASIFQFELYRKFEAVAIPGNRADRGLGVHPGTPINLHFTQLASYSIESESGKK